MPEIKAGAFEQEGGEASSLGPLNGQNLLGDHAQHLQINAVELVKARPSPGACETLRPASQYGKRFCRYPETQPPPVAPVAPVAVGYPMRFETDTAFNLGCRL